MATKNKNNARKYAAVALGIVGVAGLSLASAAQLNLESEEISVGSDIFTACDTDGIDVSYTTGAVDTSVDPATLAVSAIVLDDVAADCAGADYTLSILDASGDPISGQEYDQTDAALASTTTTISPTGLTANEIYGVVLVVR